MASIGDLVANLRLNTSGFRSGANQARGILGGLKSSFNQGISGLLAPMAGVLSVGAAIGAMKWGVQLAAQSETTQISFEVMLGSADRAKKMMADLREFASTSSFDVAGANEAAKQLINYGIQAQDVLPTMRMLGDVAQGDSEKFNSLALALGQVASTGHLRAQEKNQFINAGFNPLQEISRTSGKSMSQLSKDMEDGKISAKMVADAFKSATSEGGRYFGMTARQAQTTTGKFNTMKDSVATSLTEVGEAILTNMDLSGAFKHISDFAAGVPVFFRNAGSLIQLATIDWGIYLMEVIPYGEQVGKFVVAMFSGVWEGSKAGASSFLTNIKALFTEIMNLSAATWNAIKAGIDAVSKFKNPLTASKDAFEKTLASQKTPEPGKHFVSAFAGAYKEAFDKTMASFDKPGSGPLEALKKSKEELLNNIGNAEFKYTLEKAGKPVADVGKLGASFGESTKAKEDKSKDKGESSAAMRGTAEANKIFTSGIGLGDRQVNLLSTISETLKSGFSTLAVSFKGVDANKLGQSVLATQSGGLNGMSLMAALGGGLAGMDLKPIFGTKGPETLGEKRKKRLEGEQSLFSNYSTLIRSTPKMAALQSESVAPLGPMRSFYGDGPGSRPQQTDALLQQLLRESQRQTRAAERGAELKIEVTDL